MTRTHNVANPSVAQHLLVVLQFIGTLCLSGLKLAFAPNSLLRRLPLARIAVIATMALLIYQEHYSFTIQIHPIEPATGEHAVTSMAMASVFSFGFGGEEISATKANDEAALALIDRFEAVAKTEQHKYGVDAGVLLAASIIAGQTSNLASTNNAFGEALSGPFDTAWESWRAMTLSVLAAKGSNSKLTRNQAIQVVASLYPDQDVMQQQLTYTLERYSL